MPPTSSPTNPSCVLLSKDFLWGSRLCEAIKRRGHLVTMTASLDNLSVSDPWQCIFIDLTLPTTTVEQVANWKETLDPAPILVAFGPHVQGSLLERAEQAGCDRVLTRGQMDQQIESLLDELLTR